MAPNLPSWKAARIDEILSQGVDIDLHTLAKEYSTTYKTVCQRKRNLERQISPSARRRRGPPPVITDDMVEYMLSLLKREPDLYQDELATYL